MTLCPSVDLAWSKSPQFVVSACLGAHCVPWRCPRPLCIQFTRGQAWRRPHGVESWECPGDSLDSG